MKPRDDTAAGLATVLIVVVGILLLLALIPSCHRAFDRSLEEVRRTDEFRKSWNRNCLRQGGQIVNNYKGSPSYLCFGRDGRLLGTR